MKERADNKLTKDQTIYLLIGLVLGLLISWSVSIYAVNGNRQSMMRTLSMHNPMIDAMNQSPESCGAGQCRVVE
jgi:hypothetical protein